MKAPNNRDFVRQSNVSFSQPHRLRSFWQVVHVDPILLSGLLALCGFGLFVLNSATAGDTEIVT
ncbi:rod shape-determining protein RodA, partial [Gammaproteobacteria bacterium]|nr:rod shape-determining protein RodA [Gammaproteobacteria bacterium]